MTNKLNNYKKILDDHLREILALAIFLINYIPTFIWMWDRWFARDSYYSHGFLVPGVTLYLIWLQKDELKKLKKESFRWSLLIIVAGLGIHVLSSLFRVYFTSGFSMLIVLIGLILHFYGLKIFKRIAFPIFFLVFMLPVPLVIIQNVSFKMKIFAAQIAEIILNKMGILAVRDGSIIKMRHAYVIVDDVCSGLRSLISLTALGSVFAYWMKAPMYKRILLFLSTIPIAVITNVCRIIFLSYVSEVWGPQFATGFTHDASGFLIFGLAFVLLFAVGRILE